MCDHFYVVTDVFPAFRQEAMVSSPVLYFGAKVVKTCIHCKDITAEFLVPSSVLPM